MWLNTEGNTFKLLFLMYTHKSNCFSRYFWLVCAVRFWIFPQIFSFYKCYYIISHCFPILDIILHSIRISPITDMVEGEPEVKRKKCEFSSRKITGLRAPIWLPKVTLRISRARAIILEHKNTTFKDILPSKVDVRAGLDKCPNLEQLHQLRS